MHAHKSMQVNFCQIKGVCFILLGIRSKTRHFVVGSNLRFTNVGVWILSGGLGVYTPENF